MEYTDASTAATDQIELAGVRLRQASKTFFCVLVVVPFVLLQHQDDMEVIEATCVFETMNVKMRAQKATCHICDLRH